MLPAGTGEVLSSMETSQEDVEESETESDESGMFGMITDMTAELAACEEQMTQGMRLNLLFSLISTPQFGAFVRNEDREYDQMPSNPARDFFLRNVDFEPFLEDIEALDKARMIRELHQMTYLLNIRTLSMKLDKSDWRIISKIMLSLVTDSLDHKQPQGTATTGTVNSSDQAGTDGGGGAAQPQQTNTSFTQKVKANIG